MNVPVTTVDAFDDQPRLRGNPAGVCLPDTPLPDKAMQAIAAHMNLPETAFAVPRKDGDHDLRWFTPTCEVDLCGHATLATAAVLLDQAGKAIHSLAFHTRSGRLEARPLGEESIEIILPALTCQPADDDGQLAGALGAIPTTVLVTDTHYVGLFDRPGEIARLEPDMKALAGLDKAQVIVCAPGDGCDIESRFFAPAMGIPEDPATGSSCSVLGPMWLSLHGKDKVVVLQLSERGARLLCHTLVDHVAVSGHYSLRDTIEVEV
ncbi:MAG TPA: PhzF family phenazine biosynthesis protein [Deltaproteobacteria bacterium]|nr:PhzF family phenazine biosynthesis protein [Candidatus Binatota bacterium]HIL12487.1 PhzF family phenazine biosynthesis protein [Deltaproteobacteria bacterium]